MQTAEAAEEFDFPDDLESAEVAYQDLVFEVQHIQEQLGNKNRTSEDGQRMDERGYWEWRHKAAGALRHRLDELRALKAHIRDLKANQIRPHATNAKPLVHKLVLAYRQGRVEQVMAILPELAAAWTLPPEYDAALEVLA